MSSSSSPCAACKLLRRKCTQGCVFAPYFPPDQPAKFANVHKVFGASNVTKLLNDLQPEQREDAVNSLAYEAEARLRDPVYGCVAYISILQLRIKQVRDQIVDARKELAAYIGPTAFAPVVAAAAPHTHYLPPADYHHQQLQAQGGGGGAGMGAAGYAHQVVQHQMAGLQVQHPHPHPHPHHHHHHQQMVNAQHMALVEVARDQDMLRARQAGHANAGATVAVEAPGSSSLNADTFDGGPFLLRQQPPSSVQTEPAMALPYHMEPSPPQPSSGHSHDEVSQQHHHHHHHRHHHTEGSDEGSGGAAPPG
ncbi:LOB domain-containing protein 36-like [Oryza glaberrima]|uniref:LOB domain-containing protein n=1 Tax=Oryza glaberrima TaxID=4538 RepID=I1PDG0_ORYGL|nr:LOB domain-containing protein 36-like [Oryza glaberrima]